ncbi:Protein kinase domain - like 10 [Theobroma cacao]|nr:Protein kinase domain - like 10 [Theobroma cacao]
MVSPLSPCHPFLVILLGIHWIFATVQAQGNVSLGDFLSANDKNITWQSPSGDFAFGFHSIPDEKDQFLLAIWYVQILDRTIVWCANRQNPAERESKVELTSTGLVLKDPKGRELWRSKSLKNDAQASHAAMLDTGNFVIASRNSGNIWESFKYPTDTILPTQELDVDGSLSSALAEGSYQEGKYQLRFNNGSFILNQIDMFTGKPYNDYFILGNGSRLIFNKTGYIQIQNSNGSLLNLAPENAAPNPESNYYRATLNFNGVFTFYSYPRNPSGGGSWSAWWFRPRDICSRFVDSTARLGNGPCGYNSICEPINGRPNCTCPPGFSFLDEKNPYNGCKQDYTSYPQDCNPDGSTIEEDRFAFKSMQFADFPFSDYGILQPANEFECKQSCLRDCSCAVAILQDPTVSKDGNGTCWKKKLPLSNGWFNRDAVDRTALFKVLKSDASRKNPATPNPSDENQNQVILILGVLLGTSAVFNFFSLAAISLIFFCLYKRRLRDFNGIPSRRDLETNLRFFTYKDLEQATNRFKEELGRGAFGTVYKGELPSSFGNYVAVKKLDNIQIIHCDIKPHNVLLDDSFTAKISDFGLAKLLINNTRTMTGIRGTKGYVAPEWFKNTPLTVKVDVYSFGVMLLEIVTCRRCVEIEMEDAAILTEWAYECYSEGIAEKLVENDEEARSDLGKLEMLLKVAIWCVQDEPLLRPSMRTAQGNVSLGDFLSANDKNIAWQSPSGDFAFGFHPIQGEEDQFLLAIWYAKIPDRTIVWYANRENPAERESKVELTSTGLVLKDPKDRVLWRSKTLNNDSQASHAAMLDTGNFVIASRNSGNIWESFKYPTDTILPTQELDADGSLSSALAERSYQEGKYQLRFNNGFFMLNQIDMFTGKPYNNYFILGNGSRLIFNQSGYIQIQSSNGSLLNLAPENAPPDPESNYYRAILSFNGVFTFYSYPRNPSGGESWSAWWFRPKDICSSFVDSTARLGNGPCGYNSICEPINGRPNCTCPPGFSFLDESNPYNGCKQDYTSYPQDCNPDGSTIEEDRFEFKSMQFVDFPFSDYGILQPATEFECKQSCLLDCSCAVAILQDPTVSKDGNGTCWKKKLPLSNGSVNRETIDRTSLFKVLKSEARKNPATPNPSDENQNQVILILGVLLGTSANLVRLIGYCDEGEHRLLVYEFMQNGSLSSFLFGVLRPSWQQRLHIALGIAKGLTYLHEECSIQIIHCDIKPQNILLDDSFTAKISDFGLAKLLINNTKTLTGIRGTKGYVAPEWFKNTPLTVKVDVYSFGVMLLEIITCRRSVEIEMEDAAILTEWAYERYSEGIAEKLVENDEEARSDLGKLEMLLKVAIWCVQDEPLLRPSMRTVSMMLEGAVQVLKSDAPKTKKNPATPNPNDENQDQVIWILGVLLGTSAVFNFIIHCDIKPQNILLDDSFTAKISDFGLAKLLINNTKTLTGIRGTKGYVAPEWFRNTPLTVKVDVYSFGVMLLEIITCRRCVEIEMEDAAILTDWAYECHSEGIAEKLVTNDEEARSDPAKLEMLLKVAIWCVQDEPLLRPSMRTVSMMLEGAVQVPTPPCPFLANPL